MKRILITIVLIFITLSSNADEIIYNFQCYPRELQKAFKDIGYKLDLDAKDRTKDSWGFLKSEGSKFRIYTYAPIQEQDFDLMSEAVLSTIKE